ncbi:hypothetical protein IGK81_002061 [Enterococcus sp. DIV0703]
MTNHSSLIRKLRKERGLTQEQLTRGISQRGTLAAFESRGTKISFELLVNYLERMNITLAEYQFLLNSNSLTNKQKLTNYLIQKNHSRTRIRTTKRIRKNRQHLLSFDLCPTKIDYELPLQPY